MTTIKPKSKSEGSCRGGRRRKDEAVWDAPPPDDPFAGKALNILVMGTDYRDAENAAIAGEEEGMRSDTTFVVHVSGDRTRMEVVSIPRDSLVDIPSCNLSNGSTSKPRKASVSAIAAGAAGTSTKSRTQETRRRIEEGSLSLVLGC